MHNGCSTIRACSREHSDKFYGAPNKGPELEHLNRLFKGAQQDVSAALRIAMPEGDMPRAQQDRRCALTWPWVVELAVIRIRTHACSARAAV